MVHHSFFEIGLWAQNALVPVTYLMRDEGVRFFLAVGQHELFIAHDFCGISVSHDHAPVHDDHPGADLQDEFQIMGSNDGSLNRHLEDGDETPSGADIQ